MACQVLGVSPSGYYAWLGREPSAGSLCGCGADRTDPRDPRAVSRDLRGSADSSRAGRAGRAQFSQARSSADESGGIAGSEPSEMAPHDGALSRRFTGAGSGRSGLCGSRSGSALGGRHHVHPNVGRVSVSGGGSGCLEPSGRRSGDGDASEDRAGVGCSTHGLLAETADRVIHHSDHGTQYTSIAFGK
jgi:hypothetical protein